MATTMWKVKPVPGFNFPYSIEYLVTGAILVGIASVIVVGIIVAVLEVTTPHVKDGEGVISNEK